MIFFKRNLQRNNIKQNLASGFTLVELLVVITIFVLLTGIVLFNQSNFDNGILLNNLAYDIAFTLRQAQNFGVSVKESSVSNFQAGYGMYMNINPGGTKNFVFFTDTNPLGVNSIVNKYDSSVTNCTVSDTECVQKYSINRGNYIQKICVNNDTDCTIKEISILFKRPKLDANIYYTPTSGLNSGVFGATSSQARIIVAGQNNSTTSIVISNVGQIYVTK